MSGQEEAVQAAGEMTAALNSMAAKLDKVDRYGRRSRKYLWFDIGVTVICAVLGVVTAVAVTAAIHASHEAERASQRALAATHAAQRASASQLEFCRDTNAARAKQVTVWDTVLTDLGISKTAKGRQFYVKFNGQLRRYYRPRDCAALSRK